MKKLLILTMSAALIACLALVGCSSGGANTDAPSSEPAAEEPVANMENPWSDCATVDEAIQVAGFDVVVNEAPETFLGEPIGVTYRAMEGLVEVTYEYPASQVIVRKGDVALAQDGNISGVYETYSDTWTVNLADVNVDTDINMADITLTCMNNVPDLAQVALWNDGYVRSIQAVPLGGEDNFGLDEAALAAYVAAVK